MPPSAPLPNLPPLTEAEAGHAARVLAMLQERIRSAGGFLDFEQFMELVLYAPGLGYYSAGARKLGAGGDFATAPEISDLFSECVAEQCAQVLGRLGGGDVLEFGAGSGRMAAVILQALAARDALPERYCILEVSADLAERQRLRIAQLPAELARRVQWLERWPQAPVQGVLLANEVLDALACQRFVVRATGVRVLGVAVGTDAGRADAPLLEAERPASAALTAEIAHLQGELAVPLPLGYRSEVSLRAAPWVRAAADCLERGVLLIFDYGLPRAHYYHPERALGTLRCHFRQRAHDDWTLHPGLQDITAWVDFTRIAEAAADAGLEVRGFVTQAAFLLGTGIEERLAAVDDAAMRARLAGEAHRLLLPGEMGEAFKVMALARGLEGPLAGFVHQDLRHQL
ncbi:MAG TPA: SAM-dependent methyltransferase [Steroidobacteraceae bacterium]|nr:SAM-dependent methyltransferase [Steroidobacteraceae bacterium]